MPLHKPTPPLLPTPPSPLRGQKHFLKLSMSIRHYGNIAKTTPKVNRRVKLQPPRRRPTTPKINRKLKLQPPRRRSGMIFIYAQQKQTNLFKSSTRESGALIKLFLDRSTNRLTTPGTWGQNKCSQRILIEQKKNEN